MLSAAGDLARLAGRCEKLVRRQAVLGGDIAVELRRRDAVELGGAPNKVLADLAPRISPAEVAAALIWAGRWRRGPR